MVHVSLIISLNSTEFINLVQNFQVALFSIPYFTVLFYSPPAVKKR